MKKTIPPRPRKSARDKTYFFSDAHLGLGSPEEDKQKELRIIRFLETIRHDAKQIFIVGDLFDYWFEYKTVVPKKYFRLFTKLSELTEGGVHVLFTAGNHDFWVKDYFETELGLTVHIGPIETIIHGKRFYIYHGDGVLHGDTGYKILKRVLRNKTNIFLFSLLHPDISGWLAQWSSRTSRQYTTNKTYEENGMSEFAFQKIREGFDFVVMGHNHKPAFQKNAEGVYVNLGDWISSNTYAVFDGTDLTLKRWKTRSGSIKRIQNE